MASVTTNLDAVVQTYLNDTEFQQKRLQIVQERDDRTPIYKRILEQFTDADLDLAAFRAMLDKQLRGDACWGDGRWHFVQQINNFCGFSRQAYSRNGGRTKNNSGRIECNQCWLTHRAIPSKSGNGPQKTFNVARCRQ